MRDKVGRADVGIGLYESVTRSADGRADVGIGPYGGVTRGTAKRAVGDAGPYEISSFGIFPDENFLRQRDSVISRLFSSGLPSTMGETKEGIA